MNAEASDSPVVADFARGILRITLSRPETGNLLDDAMLQSILAAMNQWPDASVLLLSAEGPDFSIGRPKPGATKGLSREVGAKVQAALETVHAINMRLRDWPGATVAMLRGQANGAAAGFLINSDVVVAETGSHLGFAEMTYDLPPALVASYLPNRLAPRVAQYMLLSGASVDVERALAWGLVHEVHAPDALGARVDELVEFFAARAPRAIDHCKRSLYEFQNTRHADAGPLGVHRVIDWLTRQ